MASEITILGGFLGSGKTTYLNQLLRNVDPRRSAAVIINEFGDISLDGKLIEGELYSKMEITGGCLCCSLRDKFIDGLQKIIRWENPDQIYIEATGLAVPWEMKRDIETRLSGDLPRPVEVIVTVDSEQFIKLQGRLPVYDRQFEGAPAILLTKGDIYDSELLDYVRERIFRTFGISDGMDKRVMPDGEQIGVFPGISGSSLSGETDVIQFSISTDRNISLERISEICRSSSHLIIRFKAVTMEKGSAVALHFDGRNLFRKELDSPMNGPRAEIVVFCRKGDRDHLFRLFSQ